MSIKELNVSGYRSVRSVNLALKTVNVLTGPNGCGKSNLYNSVFLLARAASGGLARLIADEGGMASVFWAGRRSGLSGRSSRTAPVRLTLGVRTDVYSYELSCGLPPTTQAELSAFKLDPEIKEERVSIEDEETSRSTVFFERSSKGTWIRDADGRRQSYSGELLDSESVLCQLREPHLYPELSSLREEMSQWRFYHHFRTDPGSPLRRPQVGIRTPVLSHDGSDLAAALQTILENGDDRSLLDEVNRTFDGSELIIDCQDGRFSVTLKVPALSRPLSAMEMSDGTLRYLCLLAALMSPRPPRLLALNEPETSLHPDLLDGLARMIVQASRSSQMWITTHSRRLAELIEEYSGEPSIRLRIADGETLVL